MDNEVYKTPNVSLASINESTVSKSIFIASLWLLLVFAGINIVVGIIQLISGIGVPFGGLLKPFFSALIVGYYCGIKNGSIYKPLERISILFLSFFACIAIPLAVLYFVDTKTIYQLKDMLSDTNQTLFLIFRGILLPLLLSYLSFIFGEKLGLKKREKNEI